MRSAAAQLAGSEAEGPRCRLFYGYWPDVNGRGRHDLVVEQVSHHPPITAYHISNAAKGLSLQGHNAQKTSFSGASRASWASAG